MMLASDNAQYGDQGVFLSAGASTLRSSKSALVAKIRSQGGRGFGTPVSDQETRLSRWSAKFHRSATIRAEGFGNGYGERTGGVAGSVQALSICQVRTLR
jgi:hypothetical protein